MYKPIAEQDTTRICALMRLYKIYYRIVGAVILVAGLVIIPVLPMLVKKDLPPNVNLYVQEGESFNKNKKGVWLDSYLAKNLGINLGDEITFKYEKYEMKEKVVGLVYTPDHIYNVKDQTAIFIWLWAR